MVSRKLVDDQINRSQNLPKMDLKLRRYDKLGRSADLALILKKSSLDYW